MGVFTDHVLTNKTGQVLMAPEITSGFSDLLKVVTGLSILGYKVREQFSRTISFLIPIAHSEVSKITFRFGNSLGLIELTPPSNAVWQYAQSMAGQGSPPGLRCPFFTGAVMRHSGLIMWPGLYPLWHCDTKPHHKSHWLSGMVQAPYVKRDNPIRQNIPRSYRLPPRSQEGWLDLFGKGSILHYTTANVYFSKRI